MSDSLDPNAMKPFIAQVADGNDMSVSDARSAFDIIMSGAATPSQIGGFLMALRVKGETVDEITGAASVMREKAARIAAPEGAIDNCGTGGDASGTWNVSTAASFIIASCGVPVAKHGNRALSSKSGSADVLKELGVDIEADLKKVEAAIRDVGIGFMFAPRHHGAMRFVGPSRMELGTRTIFNLLGPLSNPAGTKRQIIGVFDDQWVTPLARVLGQLGSEKVWIVHGSDGLDEITVTGPTRVAELNNGRVTEFMINPVDHGLAIHPAEDLKGGDATDNALALRKLLEGEKGAYRDIVLINAGAALVVADKAKDLTEGVKMAAEAVDSGRALEILRALVSACGTE